MQGIVALVFGIIGMVIWPIPMISIFVNLIGLYYALIGLDTKYRDLSVAALLLVSLGTFLTLMRCLLAFLG